MEETSFIVSYQKWIKILLISLCKYLQYVNVFGKLSTVNTWLQFKKLLYFNLILKLIYSCNAKLNFQQPLLQSSVSHDLSEIILICWCSRNLSYYHCSNQLCCCNRDTCFRIFDKQKSHKNSIYLNQFQMSECIYKVGFEPRPPCTLIKNSTTRLTHLAHK